MPQQTAHRVFTAIELLALVGVAAIVLSILTPTLSAARRSAEMSLAQPVRPVDTAPANRAPAATQASIAF